MKWEQSNYLDNSDIHPHFQLKCSGKKSVRVKRNRLIWINCLNLPFYIGLVQSNLQRWPLAILMGQPVIENVISQCCMKGLRSQDLVWKERTDISFHTESSSEVFSGYDAVSHILEGESSRMSHAKTIMYRTSLEKELRYLSQLLEYLFGENAWRQEEGDIAINSIYMKISSKEQQPPVFQHAWTSLPSTWHQKSECYQRPTLENATRPHLLLWLWVLGHVYVASLSVLSGSQLNLKTPCLNSLRSAIKSSGFPNLHIEIQEYKLLGIWSHNTWVQVLAQPVIS